MLKPATRLRFQERGKCAELNLEQIWFSLHGTRFTLLCLSKRGMP